MIGIDIIKIKRLEDGKSSFINKIFSEKEIAETTKSNMYQKLAGKWAAKEAAFKAGILYANRDIEILTTDSKPAIYIEGKKSKAMVSISHEKEYATAIVFNNV